MCHVLFITQHFFILSEIIGQLLAGGLVIKVTEFSMFELILSPVFDYNESNSKNVTFELCELETVLIDGETEEDRLRGVGTEPCEKEGFVLVVDEEYE